MPQINAHYQDIEILTGGNLDNATQVDLIERLNGQIGQITKEWV